MFRFERGLCPRNRILLRKNSPYELRRRLEKDAVTLALKHMDGAAGGPLYVTAVEVIGPDIAVVGAASEHMVDHPKQRVGDGHDGLLMAAMAQPPIARGKGAALGARRRPSGLDQRAAQGA